MTALDFIRTKPAKDLVEFILYDIHDEPWCCSVRDGRCEKNLKSPYSKCEDCVIEWLNKECS